MASAETTLPAITVTPTGAAAPESEARLGLKKASGADGPTHAASFIARFQLGVVHKEPRPGDVYKPPQGRPYTSAAQPRPLGLLPYRGTRMDTLKELTRVLSPIAHASHVQGPASAPVGGGSGVEGERREGRDENDKLQSLAGNSGKKEGIIVAAVREKDNEEKAAGLLPQVNHTPFRLPAPMPSPDPQPSTATAAVKPVEEGPDAVGLDGAFGDHFPPVAAGPEDREYVDTLAKCNIKEYGISDHRYPPARRRAQTLPAATPLQSGKVPGVSPERKKAGKMDRPHPRSSSLQYVNFTGQAQLWSRLRTLDCRDAKDYIPCERCRLRGGRCSKCKAIRTGGGYIILDGSELSELDLLRRGGRGTYGVGGTATLDSSGGRLRRRRLNAKDGSESSGILGSGSGYGGSGRDGGGHSLMGGGDVGWGGGGGGGGGGGIGGGGSRGWLDTGGDDGGTRRIGSAHDGSRERAQGRGSGQGGGQRTHGDGDDHDLSGRARGSMDAERSGRDGGGAGNAVDGYDSGRQSSASQRPRSVLGSRPGSRIGSRPGSSLRRFGRGFDRRDRGRMGTELEKHSQGGGRVRGRSEEEDGSDSEDEEGRRRRRRGRGTGEDEDEGKDRVTGRYVRYHHEEEEEEERGRYTGDLMRFKSKRDNVKALKCTLKELQGIDPLDYLAKYCIIDQNKLPEYHRVYDNVDRDEDDEINISELDYALKAVNYNLITDAEMNYVHSVLELAGRHKLNFRLFSLIAALSEKVVALEDMVKRLVNSMDFEALEVKIKKCKELFYLLADTESVEKDEGGTVTTASLAVELQAGGLTSEHVEFVVDRLNHEGKGRVEFLDYLTYVPLFVEIHDSIYGNPLDFSRTR